MTRPGERLRSLAQALFSEVTVERLIEPSIADLQHEHEEANRQGRRWRGRFACAVGYIAVWKVIAASATTSSTRALSDWVGDDDRAVGRTIGFSVATTIAIAVLLMWAPVNKLASHVAASKLVWMTLYLLPQTLLFAIPMGFMFGILAGLRGRAVTARVRWSVVALTTICSIATFILGAWLLPAANQAFRELMAGRRIAARGFNEMTLGELARTPAQNIWIVSATANRLAFEFHFRLAIALGSLALGPFAIAVAAAWRGAYRVRGAVLTGFSASVAYYLLLLWARQAGNVGDQHAKVVDAWMPNLVFVAMTLLLFCLPRTTETQECQR